jgi:hypothetical protein
MVSGFIKATDKLRGGDDQMLPGIFQSRVLTGQKVDPKPKINVSQSFNNLVLLNKKPQHHLGDPRDL